MSITRLGRRSLVVALSTLTIVTLGSDAVADQPPYVGVLYDQVCAVTEPVCILVVPDGTGMRFEEARTFGGDVVDATIRVQIVWYGENGPEDPYYLYPRTDIWLQGSDDYSRGCDYPPVANPDGSTDTDGWTTFSAAPRAGGWIQDDVEVFVGGVPASGGPFEFPSLPIRFNSPDISADGNVNLTDIVLFTEDLGSGDAPFRSDFVWDGVINLSDIAVFAGSIAATCP